MNREYLNHNYFTDVITFDYTDETSVSGDIFISIDQVHENAGLYRVTKEDELRRVVIHGVLHLLGFSDSDEEGEKEMRQLENDALHLWLNIS